MALPQDEQGRARDEHTYISNSWEGLEMPLDGAVLGNLAAEQMAALEEAYGDDENVHIGGAVTIVEILRAQGEPDAQGNVAMSSDVRMRFNQPEPYRVVGLLQQASFNMLAGGGMTPPRAS